MRLAGLVVPVLCVLAAASVAEAKGAPTVAVLYFDYDGTNEEMGFLRKGLTQMLVTDLSGTPGVQVVERVRLEAALAELDLGKTRKIDKATAAKVGKLLGARYLIMGGYFDMKGTLRIDARIVEVETGRVLHSIGANRKVDDFLALEEQLAGDLRTWIEQELPDHDAGVRKAAKVDRKKKKKPVARKRPAKLSAGAASRYGRALDHIDNGDTEAGKKELEEIVEEEPDFELAAVDLKTLTK